MRHRSDRAPHRLVRRWVPLLVSLAALSWPASVQAVGPGQWTPKFGWASDSASDRRTAIHMMLLRGDSTYHSRVMWFGGEPIAVFKGGIWGWNPWVDNCATYPTQNFTAITPPNVGYNVFCSGHSGLADGLGMLVAGGNSAVTDAFGENKATIHTTGTGSGPGAWNAVSPMGTWRWYPSNTTLKDGRVLVTAGYQHKQHRMFGGRLGGSAPTSPAADTVRRWAPIEGGAWDPPVLPEPDISSSPPRPEPREGHTGVDLTSISGFSNQTLFFGGKTTDSSALNNLWALRREDNTTGADYRYVWERKTPLQTGPSPRSEHSAIVTRDAVVVFGGRDGNSTALSDVYRYTPGTEGTWANLNPAGTPPTARMGHVAIYNEMAIRESSVDKYVKRMIVHGGVATAGATPSDNQVHELRFDVPSPGLATWSVMSETTFAFAGKLGGPQHTRAPLPRYWHRAVAGADSIQLAGAMGVPKADLAYMFGGALGGGVYSDTLWMLCFFASGKYGWAYRDAFAADTSQSPKPRARFSLGFDPTQGKSNAPRLYVHGGEGATGLADPGIYTVDAFFLSGDSWKKWGVAGYSATGHVSVCEGKETHSRVGEIFDPAGGGSWTTLTGAPLLEQSYPVTFAVSGGSSAGGRVVTASSWDDMTRYADLPGPGSSTTSWQTFPNGALGFTAETGVLYRPNKLLVAGGLSGTTVVGTSKTLDASNTGNAWLTSATMLPRAFHNLVLLPDGKVLATGGATTTTNYNANPVREPQIWDPNGGGGAGTWTAPTSLASSTAVRGYHSTSILLPDARVLCAGGWGGHLDQYMADIYCPPYLFNTNGSLANRPAFNSAPTTVTYSERFTVCLASDSVTLGSLALLRAPMTTHAFDQNQRYVPLAWSLGSTTPGVERTYVVDAPWDRSQAPPGDYLLFAVNGAGTPGIARWIRLAAPSPDTDHPERVLSLQKVCSYGESVDLKWNPPAEDSLPGACKGPVHSYELRYNTSPLDPWSPNFQAGTLAETPAVPGLPGSSNWDQTTIGGLTPNTRYYFRLISKDYAGETNNWSAMSNALSFVTHYEECGGFGGGGGEGGGGSSARRVAGNTSLRSGGAVTGAAYEENTLLANVPSGVSKSDLLHLPGGPMWTSTGARVRLARTGGRGTHVESVRLLAVDHLAGTSAFARGGELVVGTLAAPASVTHADGRDLGPSLAAGNGFAGAEDDTVTVAFPTSGPGSIVVTSEGAQLVLPPSETGIQVQSRVGGAWISVARHHPRALGGDEVIDVPGLDGIRLIFHGQHTLLAVARFVGVPAIGVAIGEPTAVSHSHSSAGVAQLSNGGITLGPGEQLFADFATAPPVEGVQRSWFLAVSGAHTATSSGSAVAKSSPGREAGLPARFALHQNRPNPFTRTTYIHFDVPSAARVEITIFDLLGRRVAIVADREFEPGRHRVEWDRRGTHGREVPAGVYLYRLLTGLFQEKRTMVLVP